MQPGEAFASGSPFSKTSDVFVTGASSVAALDTPQSSQTKSEIRSIVSEIAELSASQLPQSEFLNAVLPRICHAMGASSAALWQCHVDSRCDLLGHYRLPTVLTPTSDFPPTDEQSNHGRILGCVAAEGVAVLVPPKSVRMATERPANPLDECLLVVPIKIDDRYELLLEVIQPASGGPAAQRGYLRFVAQMADLLSDFMRRSRLRHYAQRAAYVEQLQASLLAVSSAEGTKSRYHAVASALADLLNADLVLLATRRSVFGWQTRYRVSAISHVPTFDPRSEIAIATEHLLLTTNAAGSSLQPLTILASAELSTDGGNDECDSDLKDTGKMPIAARRAQQLRTLLNCHHLVHLPLGAGNACHAVLAFDGSSDLTEIGTRAPELATTFQSLLCLAPTGRMLQSRDAKHGRTISRVNLERWLVRVATVLLVLAVAFFPAPDNIATMAVLESVDKELYYSPSAGTIDQVFVDTQQTVTKGEPLVRLVDDQLQARFEELQGQKLAASSQLQHDQDELKRGGQSSVEAIGLYGRIDQLKINLQAFDDQLTIVQSQLNQLTIRARRDATVISWDAKNQLSGRPVSPGQLLLATFQPNAPWQLRLSIPERQLGRLREAMADAREGLQVQFSLSSHPGEVRHGRLVRLSDQLVKNDDGAGSAIGIVAVDGNSLPTKTDGAVARATIACGRTYAGWLAIRDAYREASAWWRLNW